MKFIKWLLAIVLALGIFGIVGIFSQLEPVETITPFYANLLLESDWLYPFFQGTVVLMALLLLVLFLMILLKPILKKRTLIQKETGQITFPVHALEAIAKVASTAYATPEEPEVKVTLDKKQQAIVQVNLVGDQREAFITRGKSIQTAVTQALKNMANVETKRVNVKIKNSKKETGLLPFTKKQSRVV